MGQGYFCGCPMNPVCSKESAGTKHPLGCMRQWHDLQDEIRQVEIEKSQYGPYFVEIDERRPSLRISMCHPKDDVKLKSDNHEYLPGAGPLVDACGLVGASSLARCLDSGVLEVVLGLPQWALGLHAFELAAVKPIQGMVPCRLVHIPSGATPRTSEATFAFAHTENEAAFSLPSAMSDDQLRHTARVLVSTLAQLHAEGLSLFGLICPQVLFHSDTLRILPIGGLVSFRALQTTCALDPHLTKFFAPEMCRRLSRAASPSLASVQLQMADACAVGNVICYLSCGSTTNEITDASLGCKVENSMLRSFILGLCAVNVRARWTCEEALEHPWLKNDTVPSSATANFQVKL